MSVCNLTRPEESFLLLAPLDRQSGGYNICRADAGDPVFGDTDDSDYQILLAALVQAKRELERIRRFDMPGFRPNEHYFREMQHFGIVPANQNIDDPIDVDRGNERDRARHNSRNHQLVEFGTFLVVGIDDHCWLVTLAAGSVNVH